MNTIKKKGQILALKHAVSKGLLENVIKILKSDINVNTLDKKSRNFLMYAMKFDQKNQLNIILCLINAGINIDHVDAKGWSCLHHACAHGLSSIVHLLLEREAKVSYNIFGYGPEDLVFPKFKKIKSLLQHAQQKSHDINVIKCWDEIGLVLKSHGYALESPMSYKPGKQLRIQFQAPEDHNLMDRLRVVDLTKNIPIWNQKNWVLLIPPGGIGAISLDDEWITASSVYRIFYERYQEHGSCEAQASTINQVDSVDGMPVGTETNVNIINLLEGNIDMLEISNYKSLNNDRRLSSSPQSSAHSDEDRSEIELDEEIMPNLKDTKNCTSGNYFIAAMSNLISMETPELNTDSEYEFLVHYPGRIGLSLSACQIDGQTRVVVLESHMLSSNVSPGDIILSVGQTYVECAGLKHTVWVIQESGRPLLLRFRRDQSSPSIFYRLRSYSFPFLKSNKNNVTVYV